MAAASPFIENTAQHFIVKDLVFGYVNQFPVSDGHVLIVPKREATTVFDLSSDELRQHFNLAKELKPHFDKHYQPDGYTIGWNIGQAGGQSVMHSHLHIIPRYHAENKKRLITPFGGLAQLPLTKNDNAVFYQTPSTEDIIIDAEASEGDIHVPSYPATDGHVLIWPQDTKGNFFYLNNDQLIGQLNQARLYLLSQSKCDGATIAWDVGDAAGQMFDRPYLQVLPRYNGDTETPRGGLVQLLKSNDSYYHQENQGKTVAHNERVTLRF